jgi:ribonucleoside-diphosphate reductase alpha chain
MTNIKKPRAQELSGKTHRVITGCGKLYITLNLSEDRTKIIENFNNMGKAGGCASCHTKTIGVVISNFLRSGGDIRDLN